MPLTVGLFWFWSLHGSFFLLFARVERGSASVWYMVHCVHWIPTFSTSIHIISICMALKSLLHCSLPWPASSAVDILIYRQTWSLAAARYFEFWLLRDRSVFYCHHNLQTMRLLPSWLTILSISILGVQECSSASVSDLPKCAVRCNPRALWSEHSFVKTVVMHAKKYRSIVMFRYELNMPLCQRWTGKQHHTLRGCQLHCQGIIKYFRGTGTLSFHSWLQQQRKNTQKRPAVLWARIEGSMFLSLVLLEAFVPASRLPCECGRG